MISLDLPMSVWEDLLAQAAMGRALGGRRDDLAPRPLAWLTKNASITLVRAASLKPPSHPPERSFGHRPLDRLWLTKRPVCGTACDANARCMRLSADNRVVASSGGLLLSTRCG